MMNKSCFIALVLAAALAATSWAESPRMKMTTPVPEGIATPETKLETQLGTLTLFDGVPDQATTQKVYDNLDLQRATQAYLSTLQVASMDAMRKGYLGFGPANTTVLLFEDHMDSKALWLTPNTVSILYGDHGWNWVMNRWSSKCLPTCLASSTTPGSSTSLIWATPAPTKVKAASFLIVPPGYEGNIPDGYYVAHTNTHGNWVLWRGFSGKWLNQACNRRHEKNLSHVSVIQKG